MSIQPTKDDLDGGGEIGARHLELPEGAQGNKTVEQVLLDPEAEKKLVWKCDVHVLPPITVLFFLSFMDRTNIGT